MSTFRRQLHRFVTIWILFQVLSLAVLLSGDCCPDPTAGRTHFVDCETAPGSECPMTALTGQPCPMHQGQAEAASPTPVISEACSMPMRVLASLLPDAGILAPAQTSAAVEAVDAPPAAPVLTLDVPLQLDTPPPRG